MADLSKIKVGDTLKIPVEVTHADDAMGAPIRVVGDFMRTVVKGKEEMWISRQLVEAAEHIPVPRVFKRGDWVKWRDGTKQVVVGDDYGGSLWVTSEDPASNIIWRKQDCEPTEAPE